MFTQSTNTKKFSALRMLVALMLVLFSATLLMAQGDKSKEKTNAVTYKNEKIDGLDIFYREAGPKDAPTVLLLHGFPTSSHMFRNLIPELADKYHVIAPDYPGYGNSSMPSVDEFDYTFDNVTTIVDKLLAKIGAEKYSIYLMDYGAPVGYRIAAKYPERVDTLIVQNGNAYEEGIQKFWEPIQKYWASGSEEDREAIRWLTSLKATKWQYTHGVPDTTLVSPDSWTMDQARLDRPGNQEVQLDLFYDYRTNIPLYPEWQAYLRKHQPPTLIVWGAKDEIFPPAGAEPYKRDRKNLEFHLLDTGHFALEEDLEVIAGHIRTFLAKHVNTGSTKR